MSLGAGVDGGAGGGTGAGSGSTGGGAGSAGNPAGSGAAGGGGNHGGSGAAGGGGAGASDPGAGKGGMGTGGTTTASWRDALPEDLKADPTLNKYSDLPNLAKAHIELQKKIGEKGVFKPKPDASAEEIKAFREAMGIPSDPTKYDMGEFDKDLKVDPSIVEWAKKIGAEHGVEPAALKAIVTDYMKLSANNGAHLEKASNEEIKKGFDGLRTEWGDAFDRNIQRANYAAEKTGGLPLVDVLKKAKLDNNPVVLKHLEMVSKLFSEDRLREAGAGDGRQTPQELSAELSQVHAQLMSLKKEDGRRPALLARWESLNKQRTAGR